MKIYVLNRKERAKRPLSIELFIICLREGTETHPLLVYLIILADGIRPYDERYLIFYGSSGMSPPYNCVINISYGRAQRPTPTMNVIGIF